jgi:circadian clock protein KaiC
MVDHPERLTRLPTGIPGLDPILEGGLLRGGVFIVQGAPGSGKTILGNQIGFNVAAAKGSTVYVTLLAEIHTRMIAHLGRMTFFDPKLVADGVYYISAFKVLEKDGLSALLRLVRTAIRDRKADLVVLDGLISAEEEAKSDKVFKKFIHELQTLAGMLGVTVILLSSTERSRSFHPEHTMVDGLIELSDEVTDLRSIRRLQVRKLRGSDQVRGQHTFEITNEGIRVHPRIETQLGFAPQKTKQPASQEQRREFGIPRLDEMLRGGLPASSMTLVLGPSGSGKTILGLQFLAEGARRNEPGLFFGFYERPSDLMRKGERIGLGLEAAERDGLLEVIWQPPIEGIIDILGGRLLSAIRKRKVRRLFIDGIHGFQLAAEFPSRVRSVFSAFAEEFEASGVTTLYSMETPDLFGPRIEAPVTGLSPITQNIILLRHVELRSHLYRLISVMKLRDSAYDSTLREFKISDAGIAVADTFQSTDQVLSGSPQPSSTDSSRKPRSSKPPEGPRGRVRQKRR